MIRVYIVVWIVANVVPIQRQPQFSRYGVLSVQDFGIAPKDSYEYFHPVKVVRRQLARGFFSRDSAVTFIAAAPRTKPADTSIVGNGWVDWIKLDSTFWQSGMRLDTVDVQ